MKFKQSPEGKEEVENAAIWEENVQRSGQGSGNSQCKGPEAAASQRHCGNSKEAVWLEQSEPGDLVGDEVRELGRAPVVCTYIVGLS